MNKFHTYKISLLVSLTFAILFVFSCNKKEDEFNGDWIVLRKESEISIERRPHVKEIVNINGKSLQWTIFRCSSKGWNKEVFEYEENEKNVFLDKGNENNKIKLKISSNKQLTLTDRIGREYLLKRMTQHKLQYDRTEIEGRLIGKDYWIYGHGIKGEFWINADSNRIEYFSEYYLTHGNGQHPFPNWTIESYKNEIFILHCDKWLPLIQVVNLKSDTIELKILNERFERIKFVENTNEFEDSWKNLYGEWEFVGKFGLRDTLLYPRDNVKYFEYSDTTNLIIDNKSICKKHVNKILAENKYGISKSGAFIVFEKRWTGESWLKWNIISLTSEELILQRKYKHILEKVKYIKK